MSSEELAVGGGSGANPFGSGAAAPVEVETGPLSDRLVSKKWNTRSAAYEELVREYQTACDGDAIFSAHSSKFAKFIGDSHPGAQEKGIEAIKVYLKRNDSVDETNAGDWFKLLVEKGLGSNKTNVKKSAGEAILLLCETQQNLDGILDVAATGLKGKVAKNQANFMLATNSILDGFGKKKITLKTVLSCAEKLAESTNATARAEAVNFFKTGRKWFGEVLNASIEKLRKAQQDEIETFYKELDKSTPPKAERLLRHEQEQAAAQEAGGADGSGEGQEEDEAEDNAEDEAYSLFEAVDIFSKFNESWCDSVEKMTKWMEKKAALEDFVTAAGVPKLKNSNSGPVIGLFKKLIANTNINVALATIKAINALVGGLRAEVHGEAKILYGKLLLKFKDRKFIAEIHNSVPNFVKVLSLDDIIEELEKALAEKAPSTKANTLKTVDEFLKKADMPTLQRNAKALAPMIKKASDDSNGDVRDAALNTLGILKGRAGEGCMMKTLSELNPPKLEKVNAAAGTVSKAKGGAAPKKIEPVKEKVVEEEVKKPTRPRTGVKKIVKKEKVEEEKKEVDTPSSSKPSIRESKRPATSAGSMKVKPAASSSSMAVKKSAGAKKESKAEEPLGDPLSLEEAEDKVSNVLPSAKLEGLKSAKWQEKQACLQELVEWIDDNLEEAAGISEALLRVIKARLKDWKESNFNVFKAAFAVAVAMASKVDKFNRRAAMVIVKPAAEKLGDIKLNAAASDCLMSLSEVVTPRWVTRQMFKVGNEAKSPKVITEICNMLIKMIEEFGIVTIDLEDLVNFSKNAINNSNSQVRGRATKLFVAIYENVGDALRNFINDIKDSTLKALDDEFSKTEVKKDTGPKRELRGEAAEEMAGAGAQSMDDLLPRADVSSLMTSKLMKKLGDDNWKVRKEGMTIAEQILTDNGMRIEPNGINEFMGLLKARLKDSNKNTQKMAISLAGKYAEALGPAVKQWQKIVLPNLIDNLADKATIIRSDVRNALLKWEEAAGPEMVIQNFPAGLAIVNPEIRNEILTWCTQRPEAFQKSELKGYIKPILSCLRDKSSGIRNMAGQLVGDIIHNVGYEAFEAKLNDLKPAEINAIKPILAKYRTEGDGESTASVSTAASEESKVTSSPTPKRGTGAKKSTAATTRTRTSLKTRVGGGSIDRRRSSSRDRAAMNEPAEDVLSKTVSGFGTGGSSSSSSEPILITGHKEKRLDQERRVKWSLDDVRKDLVEKAKDNIKANFSSALSAKMLAPDFNKGVKAINEISALITTNYDAIEDNLDLIFKFVFIKFTETSNTKLTKESLEFFSKVLDELRENMYQLHEGEACVLIPLLAEKVGMNNQIFRARIHELMKAVCDVYPPARMFTYLIQATSSKNTKCVSECLDECAHLIKTYGLSVAQAKDFKTIGKLVNSSDSLVRSASINAIGEVYKIKGESVYKMLGELPDKAKNMLEQRFKVLSGQALSTPSKDLDSSFNGGGGDDVRKSGHGLRSAARRPGTSKVSRPPTGLGMKNSTSASRLATVETSEGEDDDKNHLSSGFGLSRAAKSPRNLSPAYKASPRNRASPQNSRFANSRSPRKSRESSPGIPVIRGGGGSAKKQQREVVEEESTEFVMTVEEEVEDKKLLIADTDNHERHLIFAELEKLDYPKEEKMCPLDENIQLLRNADMTKKVDALVYINETISKNEGQKEMLQEKSDEIVDAFTCVLSDIFMRHTTEIPYRFTKYFLNIMHKVCSVKYVMRQISEFTLLKVCEELLLKLLIEDIDKLGEHSDILKILNGVMLRILEHSNSTNVFCVLISLLSSYVASQHNVKMPRLIVKCILKITKILSSCIQHIDVGRLLVKIHEYLLANPPQLTSSSQDSESNEEMANKTVKTIVVELVKLQRSEIWEAYKEVENHLDEDKHLRRWIENGLIVTPRGGSGNRLTLSSLASPRNATASTTATTTSPRSISGLSSGSNITSSSSNLDINGTSSEIPGDSLSQTMLIKSETSNPHSENGDADTQNYAKLDEIFQKLQAVESFEIGLKDLSQFMDELPDVDITKKLATYGTNFQEYVKKGLAKLRGEANDQQDASPTLVDFAVEEETKTRTLRRGSTTSMDGSSHLAMERPSTSYTSTSDSNNEDGGRQIQRQTSRGSFTEGGSSQKFNELHSKLENMKMRYGAYSSNSRGDVTNSGGSSSLSTSMSVTGLRHISESESSDDAKPRPSFGFKKDLEEARAKKYQNYYSTRGGSGNNVGGTQLSTSPTRDRVQQDGSNASTAGRESGRSSGLVNHHQDVMSRLNEMKNRLKMMKNKD